MSKTIVVSRGRGTAALPRQNIRHNPHDPFRYGVWCKVLKRYSIDHTVDVEIAEGFHVTRVPVTSREWVTLEDPILGERNLPPEGSMVFLFMPTGGIDNAFVFGSCFLPSYDKHKEEFLTEGKEDEELVKKEGNWKKKFDKVTGDLEVVGTDDNDKTLTITIKKSEGKIELTDWNDNDIVIDKNGTSLTDSEGNKVTTNDSGIKMEDKNGNKSTMDSSGMKAEDKNGNKMEMAAAGTTMTTVKAKVTGGMLEVNGVAAPTGSGPFCAIPVCPFGITHTGNQVTGT
jgi:hypothetical protein